MSAPVAAETPLHVPTGASLLCASKAVTLSEALPRTPSLDLRSTSLAETTPRTNRGTASRNPISQTSLPTTPTRTAANTGTVALESNFYSLSITGALPTTPLHISTSNIDPHPCDPIDTKSLFVGPHSKKAKRSNYEPSRRTRASNTFNQVTKIGRSSMEAIIKNELHGAVFLYTGFWDDFLPCVNSTTHDQVKMQVDGSLLRFEGSRWSFDHTRFTQCDKEEDAYKPLVALLNVIGQAVYAIHPNGKQDQFRPKYRPFSNHDGACAKGDYPSDTSTKPDLVKAERDRNHGAGWGDVEMVVECKSDGDQELQNEALLQLACYARTIFSDQIFRLYVFGLAVCGSVAIFVRFDRSGLLHSPGIDLSTEDGADLFVRKMISLLALPTKEFGYDPRYTFQQNDKGHRETLFAMDGHLPRMVNNLLCHRKCCRGRATLASCLAAATMNGQTVSLVAGPTWDQRFLDREVVHKKIWRKEDYTDEGTTLVRFKGVFAVCQVIAFQDKVYDTQVRHPNLVGYSHAASRFIPITVPPTATHTETSTSTTQSTTSTIESNKGSNKPAEPTSELALIVTGEDVEIKTPKSEQPSSLTSERGGHNAQEPSSIHPPREIRFESDLLMPKGRSLLGAQNALHVLYAMHDALLGKGIMAFAEAGMLHRDVSAYNILLINPEIHYMGTDGRWNDRVEGSLGNWVWECLSSQPLPDAVSNATGAEITKSGRSWRERYVDTLSRGPFAVLCDAEHAVKEKRPLDNVHRDRTGTPTFVSAQLLLKPPVDQAPVRRSFIHDIESLMWVLLWVVIHEDPESMNENARDFVRKLSLHDLDALGTFKHSTIRDYLDLEGKITAFGNPWSKQLAPTIQAMARFFANFLYPYKNHNSEQSGHEDSAAMDPEFWDHDFGRPDPRVELEHAEHLRLMEEKRLVTFRYFLTLFRASIKSLSQSVEDVNVGQI